MTRNQLNTAIAALLDKAEREVRHCQEIQGDEFGVNSWIVHMTASTVFAGLADTLIEVRKVTTKEEAEESS